MLSAINQLPLLTSQSDLSTSLPVWLQWGVLGAVILAIILRQLVPGWLYSDIKAENTRLTQENARLMQMMLDLQQKMLPVLETTTRTVDEAMHELHGRG